MTELSVDRQVKLAYEQAAQVGSSHLCCAPGALYTEEELAQLPEDVRALSSGCGNPVRVSRIGVGETVVDVGSGAGTDCVLAAQLTGPEGRVIGIDPSPSMRARATSAAAQLSLDWISYVDGTAEAIPLEDGTVDTVISNCVLSMSTRSDLVWWEISRILRPGGIFVVSDTVGSVSEDSGEARLRCEVGLTWPEYLAHFDRYGLGAISVMQAGTARYRDGTHVQSATFTGRKRPYATPKVAVQVFTTPELGLEAALWERFPDAEQAELSVHDPSKAVDRQILDLFLGRPSDAQENDDLVRIFIDGRHVDDIPAGSGALDASLAAQVICAITDG